MTLVIVAVLVIGLTLLFILTVRQQDLPPADPISPTAHLEERKAAIYENLRDLQFEYRVGKLSDVDYQQTKLSLQKELAVVVEEITKVSGSVPAAKPAKAAPAQPGLQCPHCGAKFAVAMKFCGECGKAMA